MYPTDCGTMTHWYSRTPLEFLKNKKPTFLEQEIAHYTSSDTGKVFDFTKKENMDYYMHLTETMVDNYEKSTALFHTIGLGERRIFKDKEKQQLIRFLAEKRGIVILTDSDSAGLMIRSFLGGSIKKYEGSIRKRP